MILKKKCPIRYTVKNIAMNLQIKQRLLECVLQENTIDLLYYISYYISNKSFYFKTECLIQYVQYALFL